MPHPDTSPALPGVGIVPFPWATYSNACPPFSENFFSPSQAKPLLVELEAILPCVVIFYLRGTWVKSVFYPANNVLIQAMGSQFLQDSDLLKSALGHIVIERYMANQEKSSSFAKVLNLPCKNAVLFLLENRHVLTDPIQDKN